MVPENTFPAPLPLSRKAALQLLGRLDEFNSVMRVFLTFVQIPVEERIGEWRFAGASGSLAEALRRVDEFADQMHLSDPQRPGGLLRRLLEDNDDSGYDSEFMYPKETPRDVSGPHRVVLCVQYGAPYEGVGACVVEVPTLSGSPFQGIAPETDAPEP